MRPFEEVIAAARFVPVLRESSFEAVIDRGSQLLDGGWPLIEIAATTPNWQAALKELRQRFPNATIGVGTVLTTDGASQAKDLGSDFLVCPHLEATLMEKVPELLVQGGFTPGEVFAACQTGLGKLFPCHVLEPGYLTSLLAVYPGLRVMPTGGLSVAQGLPWLAAGAIAVGVGSSLFTESDPLRSLQMGREAATT